MPSRFTRSFFVPFPDDALDPWHVLEYFEGLLAQEIPATDALEFRSACHFSTTHGDRHRADTLDELRSMVTAADRAERLSMGVRRSGINWSNGNEAGIDIWVWFNRDPWEMQISVEGYEQTWVLGWRERVELAAQDAFDTERDTSVPTHIGPELVAPVGDPEGQTEHDVRIGVDAVQHKPEDHADVSRSGGGIQTWVHDVSAQVVGGLILAGVLSALGIVWAVWLR